MSWLCGQAVVLHQAVCSVAVSFSTKESNNCLSVHCAASAWRQYNTAAAAAADAADAAADDDDVKVNCKADRLKAADPGQPQPLTSATDCTPGNYLLLLTSCSLIVQNSPDFYPPTSV